MSRRSKRVLMQNVTWQMITEGQLMGGLRSSSQAHALSPILMVYEQENLHTVCPVYYHKKLLKLIKAENFCPRCTGLRVVCFELVPSLEEMHWSVSHMGTAACVCSNISSELVTQNLFCYKHIVRSSVWLSLSFTQVWLLSSQSTKCDSIIHCWLLDPAMLSTISAASVSLAVVLSSTQY